MGVKERKREKTKPKKSGKPLQQEKGESAERNRTVTEGVTQSPEVVVEISESEGVVEPKSETNTVSETTAKTEEVKADFLMPSWGDVEETEWMYGIPTREDDRKLWAEEWADYLLEWTESNRVHILSLATFFSEPPFKDLRNKVDAFRDIAEILVNKEVAEWVDKKQRQLRVYWKPLEDWVDIVYQWALKTGKLRLDVKSIVIQEAHEDFASLPEKDIHIVLALLVKKGLAEWIDEKKGAILISA